MGRVGVIAISPYCRVMIVLLVAIGGQDSYFLLIMKLADEGRFCRSVITAVIVCLFLYTTNRFTEPDSQWSLWVAGIWCALLIAPCIRIFFFGGVITRWQQKRLQKILRK